MRVLFILILGLVSLGPTCASTLPDDAYYERVLEEEAEVFPDCETLTTARATCEQIKTARFRAKYTDLKTFDYVEGKRRIPYREFVLVTYDPEMDAYRDLLLGMPVDVTKRPNFQPILRSEEDADCQVKRLRGQSLNKMVFQITCAGHELHAYAAKHLLLTEVKLHPFWGGRIVPRIEEVVYLEVSPYFVTDETARAGQAVFMQLIGQAFDELRERGVPSSVSPGRLIADAVAIDSVANLLVTEQTDPCMREQPPKECGKPIQSRPYATNAELMQAVNVTCFLNGGLCYRYMRSHQGAGGSVQFTNNRSERWVKVVKRLKGKEEIIKQLVVYPGTYVLVQEQCPLAAIDPDFQRGTQSIRNLTKAAACLIDLERSGLPEWARTAYERDPDFGLPILGAAYHGGGPQARVLARLMVQFNQEHQIVPEDLRFHLYPWDQFFSWIEQIKAGIGPRTLEYLRKIRETIPHLHRHRPIPK